MKRWSALPVFLLSRSRVTLPEDGSLRNTSPLGATSSQRALSSRSAKMETANPLGTSRLGLGRARNLIGAVAHARRGIGLGQARGENLEFLPRAVGGKKRPLPPARKLQRWKSAKPVWSFVPLR